MAIHAPAHRPAVHFHHAPPRMGEAAAGIRNAAIALALVVVVAWVGAIVSAPHGYDGAVLTAAWARSGGEAAVAEWPTAYGLPALQQVTPKAQSLVAFRAAERAPLVTEAESLVAFRAAERAPMVSEAQSLVRFRAGERESR
jgi:hypothetical protein